MADATGICLKARLVIDLRTKLIGSDWAAPATWAPLALFLESLDFEATQLGEIKAASTEFDDMRLSTEETAKKALTVGRSTKTADGPWSHDAIEGGIEGLKASLVALRAFPRMSKVGIALAAEAELSVTIRQTLLGCSWADAATWAPLAMLLEMVDLREGIEYRDAWKEFYAMRELTEANVTKALQTGRSLRLGRPSMKASGTAVHATSLDARIGPVTDGGTAARTNSRHSISAAKTQAALRTVTYRYIPLRTNSRHSISAAKTQAAGADPSGYMTVT